MKYDFDYTGVLVLTPAHEWHPITSLSDGQRCLFAMALDMAYRCVVLNPNLGSDAPSETEGVVLIDEIDLHLHPKWQREVTSNLRRAFPKIQFFATTHSPLIVQSLLPGEVIDLNGGEPRDYDQQSVEEILTDEMGLSEVRRNATYVRMMKVAEEFYNLLEKSDSSDGEQILRLQSKLDTLTLPYHDNPAYAAYRSFLEQRLLLNKGDCK